MFLFSLVRILHIPLKLWLKCRHDDLITLLLCMADVVGTLREGAYRFVNS